MKCELCNKEAAVHYKFSKPLCKSHFQKQIEARVKKSFRRLGIIEKHKLGQLNKVKIYTSNELAEYLIKKIILPILKKSGIELELKKNQEKDCINAEFCDDITCRMFSNLILGRDPCESIELGILSNILRTEAYIYQELDNKNHLFFDAEKIREIDEMFNAKISDKTYRRIDKELIEVENKHPGTKFSMLKSFRRICQEKKGQRTLQ